MNNGILYYPTIEFKDEDYPWLVRASLLWDKIYRIVPEGYQPKDNKKIQALCSSGEIGIPYILGDNYNIARYNASSNFQRDFRDKFKALSKEFKADQNVLISIHESKAEAYLLSFLKNLNLMTRNSDGWFYMPKRLSDIYMTYLAQEIAKVENLSIATPNSQAWITASQNSFSSDNFHLNPFLNQGISQPTEEEAYCFPIYVKDIFPENFDLDPDKILKFREQRKDERRNFINKYEDFCNRISNAHNPSFIQDIWNSECKEIEKAITDYKKSMDLLNVVKWGGRISLIGAIVVDALGYTEIAQKIPQIVNTALLGIGAGASIISNFSPKVKSPYSYLCQVHDLVPKKHKKSMTTVSLSDYVNDF